MAYNVAYPLVAAWGLHSSRCPRATKPGAGRRWASDPAVAACAGRRWLQTRWLAGSVALYEDFKQREGQDCSVSAARLKNFFQAAGHQQAFGPGLQLFWR